MLSFVERLHGRQEHRGDLSRLVSKFHQSRKDIANQKIVFIYNQEGCTGYEQQHYQGEDCIDIRSFYSIKAFCH
jgi:hypothetical protein